MVDAPTSETQRTRIVDRILGTLFPVLLIPNRAWITPWKQRDAQDFLLSARIYFGGFFLLYLAHLFFIDIPTHKVPLIWWAEYRLGCAALNLFGLLITLSKPFKNSVYKRVPVIAIAAVCVFMQGRSMEIRADIPPFYVPLVAAFGALALRTSVATTALSLITILIPSLRFYFERPEQTHHMVSATLISFAVLAIFRSRQKQDVILFVSEMERQRVQRSLIESQQQLVDQLRTFLPKEIYGRVEIQMRSLGRTALQATDEVLRPRRVVGSVLFTDIRGFTKMTKRGGDTLVSAVIPAQKMCTDSVERHRGIPKLQGDLVYAYYDLDDSAQNLKNAILSALEINEETSDLNTSLRPEDRIIRYAIISYGDLLVGNLGGSEGSRDITVLGDAANIPSRIDAITKAPDLAKLLSERPIILTEAAMGALGAKSAQLDLVPISLPDIGLTLRDFPEQTRLFLLRASRQNHEQISAWNKQPGVEEQTRPVTMNERTAA